MGENSKISWTTHTWNPFRGCQHATLPDGTEHPGCQHCYAEAMAKRNPASLGVWGPDGTRVMAAEKTFNAPLKWQRDWERLQDAYEHYCVTGGPVTWGGPANPEQRPRVFVDSMCDVFEDWQGPMLDHRGQELWVHDCEPDPEPNRYVPMPLEGESALLPHERENLQNGMYRKLTMNDLRARVFSIIDQCPNIDFLLLTKRPENIRRMMMPWLRDRMGTGKESPDDAWKQGLPVENLWLLTSVSDQPTADAMIPHLLKCRDLSPVLGVSAEPLLGEIDFTEIRRKDGWYVDALNGSYSRQYAQTIDEPGGLEEYGGGPKLDWIITGGESGPHARPHNIAWSRSIGEQCQAAGVAWWHKQHGARPIAGGDFQNKTGPMEAIVLKDRSGADPTEWGDGWLQQMPNTGGS